MTGGKLNMANTAAKFFLDQGLGAPVNTLLFICLMGQMNLEGYDGILSRVVSVSIGQSLSKADEIESREAWLIKNFRTSGQCYLRDIGYGHLSACLTWLSCLSITGSLLAALLGWAGECFSVLAR